MGTNKKFLSAITAILLCLSFCMVSCRKTEVNTNVKDLKPGSNTVGFSETVEQKNKETNISKTASTTFSTNDNNSNIHNEPITYVHWNAEQWGVKMPEMKLNPEDPYSVKLNEIYENIRNTTHISKEYFSEYDQYVDEAIYALYDLDGDGKKELITGWDQYEGEMVGWLNNNYNRSNKGKKKMVTHIYSTNNEDNVTEWEFYGYYNNSEYVNQVILLDGTIKAIIGNADGDDDHYSYKYVKLESGEIKSFRILIDWEFDDDNGYRTKTAIDDKLKEITKEEFYKIKDEWEKDNPEVNLDWQPIHTYGKNQG